LQCCTSDTPSSPVGTRLYRRRTSYTRSYKSGAGCSRSVCICCIRRLGRVAGTVLVVGMEEVIGSLVAVLLVGMALLAVERGRGVGR
jgi:hypothetical protein